MAKISALTDGAPAVGTDQFPVARAGANRRLTLSDIRTLLAGTDWAVTDGGTGASTAIAAAQNLSTPYILAKWGVPVILASSGTMGNNGAVSAMTALPTTYSGGAWLYLPANAIVAGSAAGFYWFVASSTTAGTVYNSTFDGLSVPAVGTTTAFSTTGPGAFTGIAAGEFTIATVTVPAGAMGANGKIRVETDVANNTAAGNKIWRIKLGAFSLQNTGTTNAIVGGWADIKNLGVTNVQRGSYVLPSAGSGTISVSGYGAIDTTAQALLVFTLEKATATNHVIYDGATVYVVYGA